jgi:hypothetical protein
VCIRRKSAGCSEGLSTRAVDEGRTSGLCMGVDCDDSNSTWCILPHDEDGVGSGRGGEAAGYEGDLILWHDASTQEVDLQIKSFSKLLTNNQT